MRGHQHVVPCSLDSLVAGLREVQSHIHSLADMDEHPQGLQRGLASMSAVAEQRNKLQVHRTSSCSYAVSQTSLACGYARGTMGRRLYKSTLTQIYLVEL